MKKILVGVGLAFALMGVAFGYWTTTPSFVVAQVVWSVAKKDSDTFHKHLDVDKVAQGLVDDFAAIAMKGLSVGALDSGNILAKVLLGGILEKLKDTGRGVIKENIEKYFNPSSGGADAGSSSGEISQLNAASLFLVSQHSDFSPDFYLHQEGDESFRMVTFQVTHKPTQKKIRITARLERFEQDWKIVRLYNVVESYIPFE